VFFFFYTKALAFASEVRDTHRPQQCYDKRQQSEAAD